MKNHKKIINQIFQYQINSNIEEQEELKRRCEAEYINKFEKEGINFCEYYYINESLEFLYIIQGILPITFFGMKIPKVTNVKAKGFKLIGDKVHEVTFDDLKDYY